MSPGADLPQEQERQRRAMAALVEALTRQEGTAPLQRETQISRLILGQTQVYKIKKPLDLSFINTSTLDRRRALCERELAVNRAAAGALYQGLVALDEAGAHPPEAVTTPLEYAVVMTRFPEAARADHVLDRGALTVAHMQALARLVAAAHADAAPSPAPDLPGQIAANARSIAGELTGRHTQTLGSDALRLVLEGVERLLVTSQPLLQARTAAGFHRACHGDMHLENIVLLEGQPVPFDAIEFSDSLRFIDPWFDVAFTLTDLHRRGRSDLAQALQQAYAEASGDTQGLDLLPLYQAVRALIRTMVLCDQGDLEGATSFFALAQRAITVA